MSTISAIGRQLLGIVLGGTCVLGTSCATAQIRPDRTLPNNSNVTINGSVFNITGGTQVGRNLFHSFELFSVPTGSTALFNNAVEIQNIISRVTGGSISNIDGLISANGKANLFLINPYGIVFGTNASLNIGGSFLATTANALQFGNQASFSASNPQTPSPLLTINPSALLFNQSSIAPITNRSQAPAGVNPLGKNTIGLRVADGNSLLLVGGNVNLDGGNLRAYGGHVELAGLAAPGSVGLNIAGNTFSLSVPSDVPRADVSLTNQAAIVVFGNGGGDIAINARNLELSNSYLFSGIVGIGLGNANPVAGDIQLNATGGITLAQGSEVSDEVDTRGNGGNIKINTGSLTVQDGSQLSSALFGQGNGGNIIINASDRISFDGQNSDNSSRALTSVQPGGVGNAGNLQLTTGTFSLTNGALFSSDILPQGNGKAGNITINARDTVNLDGNSFVSSGVDANSVGKGGDIQVIAGSLLVQNGSQISTDTSGQGDAGNITIDARDQVNFDGVSIESMSSAQSRLLTGGIGKGGNIQITTGSLSVTNGAEVATDTEGQGNAGSITINARDSVIVDGIDKSNTLPSLVSSTLTPNGVGNGGNIQISARALFLTHGGEVDALGLGQGNAGKITINAGDTVAIDSVSTNGLPSGAQTNGLGNGGDIQLTTGTLSLTNGGELFSVSRANAGNITVSARDAITIDGVSSNGRSSGIFSSLIAGGVGGKGGDIQLATNSLTVSNGAALTSFTSGQGNAGNINVTTGSFSLYNGSKLVSSTSGRGNGGNITIDARNTIDFNSVNSNINRTGIDSTVESGGVGNAGNISVTTGSLSLNNGSQVSASTVGQGNAGDININARDTITLSGTSSNGRSSGVLSEVGTGGAGKGGNVNLTTGLLWLTNGAELVTSTFGKGDSGNIMINARGTTTFDGTGSNSSTGVFSTVQAGGIGNAGDIQIASGSIRLNHAGISAETFLGEGGNILLEAQNVLFLRHGSIITTSAGVEKAGGDGGNITINTPFIVAVPLENSDITANAFTGSGGRVTISATDYFNIAPLSRQDLERLRPNDLDPTQLLTNDITAISQTNPSLNGQVTLPPPEIDPGRGIVTLPTVTENIPKLVSSSCAAFADVGGSNFTVTGRSGLPPSPDEPLTSDVVWTDTRLPVTTKQHQHKAHASKLKPQPIAIIPATGWVLNDLGEVTLISSVSKPASMNSPQNCPAE